MKSKSTREFREGAVESLQNQYPRIIPTVDIAVINSKLDVVLLGRKPNEKSFRFPGGFCDVRSNTFEDDAIRELLEETGLVALDIEYIGSTLINDWRFVDQVDKIKTLLFLVKSYNGSAKAGDDLDEVVWFSLNTLKEEDIVHSHRSLYRMMINWITLKNYRNQ